MDPSLIVHGFHYRNKFLETSMISVSKTSAPRASQSSLAPSYNCLQKEAKSNLFLEHLNAMRVQDKLLIASSVSTNHLRDEHRRQGFENKISQTIQAGDHYFAHAAHNSGDQLDGYGTAINLPHNTKDELLCGQIVPSVEGNRTVSSNTAVNDDGILLVHSLPKLNDSPGSSTTTVLRQSVNCGSQHECSLCSRQFQRRNDFQRHIQSHFGIKPYVCHICGDKFVQSGALTVHTRVHTGEKPYKCTLCGRAFSDGSSFSHHKNYHARKRQSNGSNISLYYYHIQSFPSVVTETFVALSLFKLGLILWAVFGPNPDTLWRMKSRNSAQLIIF